jgi:putative Holliday junction resolvase
MEERFLALDVGEKTIGLAVSDPLNITAQGLDTIFRQSYRKDFEALQQVIDKYNVTTLVVGLPKRLNGEVGIQGEKVIKFVKKLERKIDVEIEYQDERMTTKMAEDTLIQGNVSRKKRKKVIDKLAAVNILSVYLDKRRRDV